MTLLDAVNAIRPEKMIKVGATDGVRYFYIGTAKDLSETLEGFGYSSLRYRQVDDVWEADQVADPNVTIIMVTGNDIGRYWSTDEDMTPTVGFGWGWHF